MSLHKCLTCNRYITWRFAICSSCEQMYGASAEQWPDWLRFMWNDIQRERRRYRRNAQHEVPLEAAVTVGRSGKMANHKPTI